MSNIKLFVVCHKDFNTLNNNTFVPIQVGAKINGNHIDGILHDDDKEPNISLKNKMYCEMTAHYYAYKHIDADYYGFLHYRRYFSFKDEHFKTNFENLITEDCLNEKVVEKYGLDEKTVADIVEKYDVLIPEKRPSIGSIKSSYSWAKTQSRDDYNFCCEYIEKNYPEMIKAMKKYNRSWSGYYCNMFVMKKQIFMDYAKWLFEILEAQEKHFDMEHYDVQSYRVSGYLAERLTGIYLTYLIDNTDLKIKKLQVIKFLNCEKPKPYDDTVCNAVIECNSKNYNQTNVLVNSIVKNTSPLHQYKILILEKHLKDYQKALLKQYQTKNVNIEILKNNKKSAINCKKYIKICPNSLVLSDIYELYDKQVTSKFAGTNNLFDIIKFGKTRIDRQSKKLQKNDVYKHIDNSVVLVNTEAENENADILDLAWNLPVNQKLNINQKLYAFGSHSIYEKYVSAKKSPKIVTYHGKILPLVNDMSEMANMFWKYAESSNMFLSLLRYNLFNYKRIRKSFYDTVCPVGSPLRDLVRTYFKKY